ncbi:DNA repair protein RAD51 homolog 2-like, partial [Stegodyphus dumicola]|uniref:DNA repair protein RAD51 homolog 2-like n=1 Tax=Stegodyphus dumicola TaxID=202533 RepID=UPI0015A9B849
ILLTNQITSHVTEYESVSSNALSGDEEEDPCDFDKQEDFSDSPPPATVRRKKMKMHQRVNADRVIPALGTTWFHCVNTRLVAQFLDTSVRQLAVMKSPVAPNVAVRYIIDESGIVLTDDDMEFISMPDMECLNISTKNNFLTAEITGTGRTFATSVSATKS